MLGPGHFDAVAADAVSSGTAPVDSTPQLEENDPIRVNPVGSGMAR